MLNKVREWLVYRKHDKWNNIERAFLPAALELAETPPVPWRRWLLWLAIVFLIIFMLWSLLGRVDEVAVAQGKVIPAGLVKVVQAEDKGVIKGIYIKEGQSVRQGQLLIELDATISAADLARIKHDAAYYVMEAERLIAEASDKPFTPQAVKELDKADIDMQRQLYESRMGNHRARVAAAQASVLQARAALLSVQARKSKSDSLYAIALEKEQRIEKLVAENAVAQFVLLDYRSKRIDMESDVRIQEAEIQQQQAVLAQSQQALASVMTEWNTDLQTKLLEARMKWFAYSEELKKAEERERLSRLVAPVDGRITQLSVHTIGGVVTAAQPLMVVVPDGVDMEVEAWVANKDVGFIYPGQKAEIKVETFSFQKFGTIQADIREISADAVDDKEKGRVYRVLLALDKKHLAIDGNVASLLPGMSVTAEVKIREKRIIEFFLDPFRQYKSEALRER